MPLRRCAVIGSPVAHSLSPVMHRAAYDLLGLDWVYDAIDVEVLTLGDFLSGLDPSWRGLSLTMPLKRAVLPLLDDMSPTAAEVGAANTVVLERGRRFGDNTDAPGMVAALTERQITEASSAAVLGTGATAASALCALSRLDVREVTLCGRNRAAATALATRARSWGMSVAVTRLVAVTPVDLLISTLPGSVLADHAAALVERASAVFDVSYAPWPSPLLTVAAAAGRATVTGLDLLAHQAALQVLLMAGSQVPVDVLRDAAWAALGSPP